MNTIEFIKKAKTVHGDKYDYSKVNYINAHTKVCIICSEHGEFWQTPNHHLNGCGCGKCKQPNKHLSKEQFIEKAKQVHGDKYDYSKVEYVNVSTKVCIICPEHGEFWQTPHKHINHRHGCAKCNAGGKYNASKFIEKAKQVHGDKYDYSKVEYVNNKTKVCIICPEHGEFWQKPSRHLEGRGCRLCHEYERRITKDEFINRATKIHLNKYNYSEVNDFRYVKDYITIICPEHGRFVQTVNCHLNGNGCPCCTQSKIVSFIEYYLKENKIEYDKERGFNWLVYNKHQFLDFYLPNYNIGIEVQGEQHYKPIEYFGGVKTYEYIKKLDENKLKLCNDNGVKLIYVNFNETKTNIVNKIKQVLYETTSAK